jgi:hypothetical protein
MSLLKPLRCDRYTAIRNILINHESYTSAVRYTRVHTVVGNEDSMEGRGRPLVLGLSCNQREADAMAKNAGPMGGRADVRFDDAIHISLLVEGVLAHELAVPFDRLFVSESLQEDVRARALAKLTEEEKFVLGLK